MVIREYRPEDFERIYRIDQAAFDPALSYSREDLRSFVLTRRSRTLVAEVDGEVAAFVNAVCVQRGWGVVITLDVAPERQRLGIGSRLMTAIEEWLAGQGVRLVALETPADESGARQFYERHGYQVERRVRGYYHGRLDAFSMTKRLDAGSESGARGEP
jgi:ribosomal protein S18 acetylase RimI-like enzyme